MADNKILHILNMKSIAIVGVSKKLYRPSYKIFRYLNNSGYRTFLVNPNYSVIDQVECHENLKAIKSPIEVVNIFRKSEHVLPIIKSAIELNAKAIWMQDGVQSKEAYNLAKSNGLFVVMNDCILRQHKKLHSIL